MQRWLLYLTDFYTINEKSYIIHTFCIFIALRKYRAKCRAMKCNWGYKIFNEEVHYAPVIQQ